MVKQKTSLKKVLKRWGNNLVTVFTAEEESTHNIKVGDVVEISDIKRIKKLPSNQTIEDIKKEVKK
jgi:hypothetical protein